MEDITIKSVTHCPTECKVEGGTTHRYIPIKKYTEEDLIQICRDAVVPYQKWNDRDSYSAQVNVASIYEGLTGGVPYTYKIDNRTIGIYFKKPTPEMFDGYGIDWNSDSNYFGGYLPTPDRLKEADGEDWY